MPAQYMTVAALGAKTGPPTLLSRPHTQGERPRAAWAQLWDHLKLLYIGLSDSVIASFLD